MVIIFRVNSMLIITWKVNPICVITWSESQVCHCIYNIWWLPRSPIVKKWKCKTLDVSSGSLRKYRVYVVKFRRIHRNASPNQCLNHVCNGFGPLCWLLFLSLPLANRSVYLLYDLFGIASWWKLYSFCHICLCSLLIICCYNKAR